MLRQLETAEADAAALQETITAARLALRQGNFSGAEQYDLFYLGLETPPTGTWHAVFFGAAGQDEFEDITGHYLLGTRLRYGGPSGWGAEFNLEFQQA